VVADAVYGTDSKLRLFLEARQQPYVLAVTSQQSASVELTQQRVKTRAAQLPAAAWRRLTVGAGAKGPRRCRPLSVNLTKVARAFSGPAQLDSHYKRLQRFLHGFDCLGNGRLARLLAGLSGVQPPWVLSLDRSDWRPAVPGAALPWINFLVLGIVRDSGGLPAGLDAVAQGRQ
jgi:hypothetical protein